MSVVSELTALVFCDECGTVARKDSKGWRSWSEPPPFQPLSNGFTAPRHHCPGCADINGLIAGGLVYGVDPASAVVYESEKKVKHG